MRKQSGQYKNSLIQRQEQSKTFLVGLIILFSGPVSVLTIFGMNIPAWSIFGIFLEMIAGFTYIGARL